jgi:hypothetical protein
MEASLDRPWNVSPAVFKLVVADQAAVAQRQTVIRQGLRTCALLDSLVIMTSVGSKVAG